MAPAAAGRRRAVDLFAWGGVAALAFLVLALAYRILTPASPPLIVLLPVALLVGVAGAGLVALWHARGAA